MRPRKRDSDPSQSSGLPAPRYPAGRPSGPDGARGGRKARRLRLNGSQAHVEGRGVDPAGVDAPGERRRWYVQGHEVFGEEPERYWRADEIEDAYRAEHPEWSEEQVRTAASRVYYSLHRSILDWNNSQTVFHSHATLIGLSVDQLPATDHFNDL